LKDLHVVEERSTKSNGDGDSEYSRRTEFVSSGPRRLMRDVSDSYEAVFLLSPERSIWATRDPRENGWHFHWGEPFMPASYRRRSIENVAKHMAAPQDPALEWADSVKYTYEDRGEVLVERFDESEEAVEIIVKFRAPGANGEHQSTWRARFAADDFRLLSQSVRGRRSDGAHDQEMEYEYEKPMGAAPRLALARETYRSVHRGENDRPQESRTTIERRIRYEPLGPSAERLFSDASLPAEPSSSLWSAAPKALVAAWTVTALLAGINLAHAAALVARYFRATRSGTRKI
jgi:hypothetical protein